MVMSTLQAWQAHEEDADMRRGLDDNMQTLRGFQEEFDADHAKLKADRQRLWLALDITQAESRASKRLTRDGYGEPLVAGRFPRQHITMEALFCFHCGRSIVDCHCQGLNDRNKMLYLDFFPKELATATPGDKVEWHASWLDRTAHATSTGGMCLRSWYIDWQPLFIVVLQRSSAQILAAAEQFVAFEMDLDTVAAGVRKDLSLGMAIFPDILHPVGIKTYEGVQAYALGGVKKLLQLDFAKLSMIELWFCDAAWARAGLSAEAVEILRKWRDATFSSLLSMFKSPCLCPDYKGVDNVVFTSQWQAP